MDLSALGITKEDLQRQIIARAVAELIQGDVDYDKLLRDAISERVDVVIAEVTERIGKEEIEPKVTALIEGVTFQETNSWGEPKKPPKTWREYLVDRAENWLKEPVNSSGKTKAEDSYNWRENTTRIAYMVDKYIQFEIKTTMEKALAEANSQIAGGIVGAIKTSLQQVLANVKVNVTTGR